MTSKSISHLQFLIFAVLLFGFARCNIQNLRVFVNHFNAEKDVIPYQAQLIQPGDDKFFCGAAIISKTHFLTAASCIKDTKTLYQILVGSTQYRTGQVHSIHEVKIHPNFRLDTLENDIALVKLEYPLEFNDKVNRIKLSDTMERSEIIYHGFGLNDLSSFSSYKSFKMEEVHPISRCKNCVQCPEGKCNICQAHSGEILERRGRLIGIVSRPSACIDITYAIHFTPIKPYLEFIQRETASLSDAKKKAKKPNKAKKGKEVKPTFYVGISKKEKKLKFICGGVLISKKHFLTAENCMDPKGKYVVVLPGAKRDEGTSSDVKKIKSFKKKKFLDAIGLFLGWFAGYFFRAANIPTAILPKKNEKFKDGEEATFLGYGLLGKPKPELLTMKMGLYNPNRCKNFGGFVLPCYYDKKRTGTPCKLDSGGPIILKNKLIGIVGFSKSCDNNKKAIAFADVRLYVDSIMKETKNLKE